MKLCKKGNAIVSNKPDNQLTNTANDMADERALCGKHSAVYKNGIGPRPSAKHMIKIMMAKMLKYLND